MAEGAAFSHLVVIGASAGGIDALSILVAALPADLPAPVVIAQHHDPARIERLRAIFADRANATVETVTDASTMRPGAIYIVPADRDMSFRGGVIRLGEVNERLPHPSIDAVLTSAAEAYRERLIAVILTGSGSDGATGALRVKEAGGTVVVQSPETAAYPSMPMSLSPATVDVSIDLGRIAQVLVRLLAGTEAAGPDVTAGADGRLPDFLDRIRAQTGIDFSSYKAQTIQRRLRHRMAAIGVDSIEAYVRHIERHPDEVQRVVAGFLIKFTEFFRDQEMFDYLRDEILPELRTTALRTGELRLWSAGCATGEEAYSLAILVHEVLGADLEQVTVRIFATDLDPDAVYFARRGLYSQEALAGVAPDLVERYFTWIDGAFEVIKEVRSLVVFGQHDLGQRAPFPRIDLTLCRNVLIYFAPELQKRSLQLFAFSLRMDGFLVLGKAESVGSMGETFVLEHPRLKVFRRVGKRVLIPPARIREGVVPPTARPLGLTPATSGLDVAMGRIQREARRLSGNGERPEGPLMRLPFGVVLVDRRYDIVAINAIARRLLGVHTPGIGEDLVHQARRVASDGFRATIDAALRGVTATVSLDVGADEGVDVESRTLEITAYPERIQPDDGPLDHATVVIIDTSARSRERQALDERITAQQEEMERQAQQIAHLTEGNRRLLDANQQLTVLNAELLNGNEDLLVANEEVQAATEEVETLNEELQATNEELETMNEELQATVEELNTTNDDLEAQSLELRELATSLEEQRREGESQQRRLKAILDGIGDGVLVVSETGQRLLSNPAFDRMIDLETTEIRLTDSDRQTVPPDETPYARTARGESFSMEFTVSRNGTDIRYFEAIGRPVPSGDGPVIGVLVVRDITDRNLRRLQNQFLAMASHELRTPLTALSGYVQLLERAIPLESERLRRYARLSLEQVQRLVVLLSDLIDVTRLSSDTFEISGAPVDVVAVATRSVETARTLGGSQEIALEVPDDPVVVSGDGHRLEQVLLNLLTNAQRYAPESPAIEVRLDASPGWVEVSVVDRGPGIPPDELDRIFQRFTQIEPDGRSGSGGLGLGLFIARQIVESHGGILSVESELGIGSVFTVRLPRLDAAPDA